MDICSVTQSFAQNANDLYKKNGLKGHNAIDSSCGYGSNITSKVSGKVVGLWTPQNPAPSDGYTAIYILCTTKLETFEWCTGHPSEILIDKGARVEKGQLIGKEGNKGSVYYGGIKITLKMQKAGDRRGSHRHDQKRPVRLVAKRRNGFKYLQYGDGYLRSPSGMYYEYAIDNDFAGCVDWTKPLWNRDIHVGITGYDVELLQRALGLPPEYQTGYFGLKTQDAVAKFQKEVGLSPTAGYVGPKTRGVLNLQYGQLDTI